MTSTKRLNSLPLFAGVTVLILLAGFLSGVLWPSQFVHALTPYLNELRDLAMRTQAAHSVVRTIFTIFLHNLLAALLLIGLGLLAGIYPAVMIWMNGLIMGFMTVYGAQSLHTAGWKVVVYGLMPHGIFELTAILWSAAIGIQLGFTVIQQCGKRLRTLAARGEPVPAGLTLSLSIELRRALHSLPFILGLLLIAACIEGAVTPHIIRATLGVG